MPSVPSQKKKNVWSVLSDFCIWVNHCAHVKWKCIHASVPLCLCAASVCVNHCQTTIRPGGVVFKSKSQLYLLHLITLCVCVCVCVSILGCGWWSNSPEAAAAFPTPPKSHLHTLNTLNAVLNLDTVVCVCVCVCVWIFTDRHFPPWARLFLFSLLSLVPHPYFLSRFFPMMPWEITHTNTDKHTHTHMHTHTCTHTHTLTLTHTDAVRLFRQHAIVTTRERQKEREFFTQRPRQDCADVVEEIICVCLCVFVCVCVCVCVLGDCWVTTAGRQEVERLQWWREVKRDACRHERCRSLNQNQNQVHWQVGFRIEGICFGVAERETKKQALEKSRIINMKKKL